MSDWYVCEVSGSIPVFRMGKYFDDECGAFLAKAVEEHLYAGRISMVIDFSGCKVVNSPGVGKMLEITLTVTSDFKGTLVLCGLDNLTRRVFQMATILPMCREASTVDDALRELNPLS